MDPSFEHASKLSHEKMIVMDNNSTLADEIMRNEVMHSISPNSAFQRPESYSAAALTDTVIRDLGSGMYQQIKEHPIKLGMEMGVGAAISVGSKFLPPRINGLLIAAGAIAGVYNFGKKGLELADHAAVIGNSESSNFDLELAHKSIQSIGRTTMDVLALSAGGSLGYESARMTFANTGWSDIGGTMPTLSSSVIKDGLISASLFENYTGLVPKIPNLISKWVDEADEAHRKSK